MSEMVERVARAIYERATMGSRSPWETLSFTERGSWMPQARAAIAAMREPTEAMIHEGRGKMPIEVEYRQEGTIMRAEMRDLEDCVSPATVFVAMIDAALSDQPSGGSGIGTGGASCQSRQSP